MRSKLIIPIVALTLIAGTLAWGVDAQPPWEVRSYLSAYTDAGTHTWNMSVVRKKWVCPATGYSTSVDSTGDVSPDVWNSGEAGKTMVPARPLERILGLLTCDSTDAGGTIAKPLVGRPFHPGVVEDPVNPDWNDPIMPWVVPQPGNVGSYVTARAAGLSTALAGHNLAAAGDRARFLVVMPGAVRAAARAGSKQVTVGGGVAVADDWEISVNPYRVSDGDRWIIRQYEDIGNGRVTIQVYSTLYGLDFEHTITDAGQFAQFQSEGCVIITNSGALRIHCHQVSAAVDGTYMLQFDIRSNTCTLPSPEEMNYNNKAWYEPSISEPDATVPTTSFPPKKPYMWVADVAGGPTGCVFSAGPVVGTDFEVEEKRLRKAANEATFVTTECWPYRIPPGAVGLGRVMVQWCKGDAGVVTNNAPGPGVPYTYYAPDGEWLYAYDPADASRALATNQDVADGDVLPPPPGRYAYVDCRFMSTRVEVPLTGDDWVNSVLTNKGTAESDTEAASGGYTRLIVGEGADPTLVPSPVGGEYNPGSSTPTRPFYVANRAARRTVVCPVKRGGCGTHFPDRAATGDPDDPTAGEPCPICGRTLVAEPGEAELYYDTLQPPNVLSDGVRHSMPAEAVRFGPSNNKAPMGSTDFLQTVRIDIPRYQPPSVPAGGSIFENDIANDPGYVGTMLSFHRPVEQFRPDVVDTSYDWDVYYQSPNNGYKQPGPGPHTGTGAHATAELYCPVCDGRYSTRVAAALIPANTCPFCGETLQSPLDPADQVPESCLMCEEFDALDLQVSVNRKVELACDQRTVDLGWVAPGVPQDQPNTVSATMALGSVPWPVDVSKRSDFVVRNEGNIRTPTQMRAGYLFRPEIDSALRSWARNGQSVPATVGTLRRFRPAAGGDAEFPVFPLNWVLSQQERMGAAGMDATARLQAGIRSGPTEPYPNTIKPVPLGQPAGNYAGEVLVYADLDGDGQLGFIDAEVGPTDTGTTEFDPDVDEPYEPVAAFSARMRVVESRLPHDDFYSRDAEPTGVFDNSLDNLQVVWVGNRLSAAGASAGNEAAAGTSTGDVPSSNDPFNILYANADVQVPGPGDPFYRGWLWQRDGSDDLIEAKALSGALAAAVANSSPTVYLDEDAASDHRWVMWHRRTPTTAGVDSQLRFDSSGDEDWSGSSPTEFIYGTDPTRFGLKAFAKEHSGAPGDTAVHWLFWHTGPKGRERIRYRWDFDPNAGLVTGNEATLQVSNAVAAGRRSDVWYNSAGQGYKKPSHGPFTYVKDPSVFEQIVDVNGTLTPYVHVFFAGHVRAAGNSDVCWVKFAEDFMQDPAANFGKQTFPRIADNEYMPPVSWDGGGAPMAWAGEELQSDGRRSNFWTRHLDWLVSDDTQDDPADGDEANFATAPDPLNYGDPQFCLGVIWDDAGTLRQDFYEIDWTVGTYSRSSGTYVVTPVLTGLHPTTPPTLPTPPGHPHAAHIGELLDPHVRVEVPAAAYANPAQAEEWPSVRMQMDPAAGTIRWTSPLFNSDDPADPLAVFNTGNVPGLVDVVMYADYTPYTMRITTDGANDDCPSAFYDLGDTNRLTVFWRRSYGSTDTPHFGRTDFMHKSWTMALQVGRPPIDTGAGITVTDVTPSPSEDLNAGAGDYTVDGDNGIITLSQIGRIGHIIRVAYTSRAGGPRTEYHRIVGWSTEMPVPVDTVVSEGPLRVVPETYEIPDGLGGADTVDVVRYWLFWSSPRGTYDVRDAADGGQQVHQSSDVYCAVVAPEYGSLIREVEVARIGP